MKKLQRLGKALTKEEQRLILGGVAAPTSGQCGVKINGTWRAINDSNGNGATKDEALKYVNNGWATNWCCDSCPW